MKKIKILLIQITNKNYGDSVIADNTRFLLRKAFPKSFKSCYDILDYSLSVDDTEQVKYVDAVVFAGGGIIKFKYENFYHKVSAILYEAEKYGVPVFLNAVGVEGFDPLDERCLLLKDALNLSCVKAISVRDDFQLLADQYIENSGITMRPVFDPAIWTKITYGDKITSAKTGYVGIGIAREGLFHANGISLYDRQSLLDLWKNTALELEVRGYQWKLFTNGLDQDERFAEEVLAYIGHGEKVPQPRNALDLVNTIHSFDSLIACRMHANIIAYSLKIPSIGLVWNDKLRFWGNKIGCPERFIEAGSINAASLVNALQRAQEEGCRGPGYFDRRSVLREIKRFVKKYCHPRGGETEKIDFKTRMVATALGGMDFKYKNTNTIDAFRASTAKGYQYFEVDVRLTSDNRLVCVNGWSKDTFHKLHLNYAESSKDGLSYDDFMKLRYYHQFDTVHFSEFLEEAAAFQDVKIILDIGKPKVERTALMLDLLMSALKNCRLREETFIVRLQREKDVELLKSKDCCCEIAYFFPAPQRENEDMTERYKQIIRFCQSQGIRLITMTPEVFCTEISTLLSDNSLSACVLTCTKTRDIIDILKNGGALAGSHYYGPDYLERLTC